MRKDRSRSIYSAIFLSLLLCSAPIAGNANPRKEYKAIVYHLKSKYHAKKMNLFVMWMARAFVSISKPAGVKSFSVTVFQGLQFSGETVDKEMQAAMRSSYGPEWSPIFHVRSRDGQQAYLYMKDAGEENVKVVLVTINKENAAVIRATFSPDKVAEFINDPKIFGIRLDDDENKSE